MKKFWRYLALGALAVLLLGMAGFLLWASNPPAPEPQALSSLNSTEMVKFETNGQWLVFAPAVNAPTTGLILYPGGRVDARAYAAHAREIAEQGYLVVIVPMPLNFAFLGINRAGEVIDALPEIEYWTIGGHSLGGAMAAEFAGKNPTRIAGLALWAAYPAQNTDLSTSGLSVISIYGDRDNIASLEEIAASRSRLPADTAFVEITGGNHAGFGWYGEQNGDGLAEISKSAQQAQIVEAMVKFLAELSQ